MTEQLDLLLAEADKCFDRDELLLARSKYRQALCLEPSARINNCLGMISFRRGHLQSAIKSFMKAVKDESQNVYFWVNLGTAYGQYEDFDKAHKCFNEALCIDEFCWEALNAGGSLYAERGHWTEAEGMFNRASLIEPYNTDLLNNMGNVNKFQGDFLEAKKNYMKALAVDPENSNLLYNLGCLAQSNGQMEEAIEFFEKCLQIDEENTSAKHLLSALKGEETAAAPESYITELFDAYASSFDNALEFLGYDIPKHLHNLLGSSDLVFDQLLDLGCGTGLSGVEFKDCARVLTGVDLSSSMLQMAKKHQTYDHLHQGEIVKFLIRDEGQYDIFISSDVLSYIGDLEAVFSAAVQRATPGARFLFSVETTTEATNFQLQKSGRYSHSIDYVERLAELTGWNIESSKTVNVRKDKEKWIEGAIYLFRLS
jgi:predicted TPR repeat methyltransferase